MADDADIGRFSPILYFDPLMVAELALGADHPHDIAESYDVSPEDYEHLAAQPWFEELVARKRVELHDSGVLFQAKAGMMAESLLTRLYQQSMAAVLPPPLMVEVAKQLTDIGRLKPQPQGTMPTAGSGAPFQINIQVNGAEMMAPSHLQPVPAGPLTTPPKTSDHAAPGGAAAAPAAMTLDFKAPKGTPPATISNLKVRDFDLRPNAAVSLAGTPSAQAAVGIGIPTPPKPA